MAKQQKTKVQNVSKSKPFDPESSPYFTPLAFVGIAVALLVLFSDFIFSSKMLHGSDTIQAGIFFRSFLVDSVWQNGSIPQWNPYIFGGMPYVEAFHGDIFYPLSFLKYFGSIYKALGYVLIMHIFLAGLFMYSCAREFKLSKVASLMSAISYMFASYLISLVAPGHDGKIFVTTLFPLTIMFTQRGFEAKELLKSFFNFSMLGLVIGFIILSPHPQMSYYSLWAISFFAAFKLISNYIATKSVPGFLRPAMLTTYAVVIGLLLSAIQFYPGYKYTTEFSPRTDSKSGWEWATSWSLHEEEAFSLLVPEFSGVNSSNQDYRRSTVYWGKNAFKDNSESVGIVGIFMALLGLFFVRKKESYFFGGLALFALIYALGATTPLFKLFFYLIPKVKALRAPSMIMFLFSFSIAMLAGMGMQKIMDASRSFKGKQLKQFKIILFGFPLLLFVLAILFSMDGRGMLSSWISLFHSDAPRIAIQQGVSKADIAFMNISSIQSGLWLSFLFTAMAAVAIWVYQSKKAGIIILCGMLLIPVINSVRFNKRFVSTTDQTQIWQENQFTRFFTQKKEKFRVMNFVAGIIKADFLPYFGVEMVVGYHGNQLKWYDKLLGGPNKKNQGNPNFLNLAGAKYILFPANQAFPDEYFGDKPVFQAANFGQFQIMQNDNALPRVFLTDNFQVFEDTEAIINRVINGENDFSQVVYLEEQPELTYAHDSVSNDSATISEYLTDAVKINLSVTQNKILVLTDNYYNAWKVTIDGKPGKILRAYGTFRAVEIQAGAKEVVFKFESERYAVGKLSTNLTVLFLMLIIGIYFVSGYRRKKKEVVA